jgi:hypothetical protein
MVLEVGPWELWGGSQIFWDFVGYMKEDVGEFWGTKMWVGIKL